METSPTPATASRVAETIHHNLAKSTAAGDLQEAVELVKTTEHASAVVHVLTQRGWNRDRDRESALRTELLTNPNLEEHDLRQLAREQESVHGTNLRLLLDHPRSSSEVALQACHTLQDSLLPVEGPYATISDHHPEIARVGYQLDQGGWTGKDAGTYKETVRALTQHPAAATEVLLGLAREWTGQSEELVQAAVLLTTEAAQ